MNADRFAQALGLTPCEAAIMAVLHRVGSVWISVEALSQRTASASREYDHAIDGRRPKTVCVHIHSIRAKLGQDAILSMWGKGYTLGAAGVLLCRRALKDAAAQVAA